MTLLTKLRIAIQKRAAYRQTLRELRWMTDSLAEDLNIYPGDARKLARTAVYG